MAKLISTVLPESVTPDWLARTYSEYLYACAEDQIDINNAISDACDDNSLEELAESYRTVWDNNIDVINSALSQFAITNGCSREDIQTRSATFIAVCSSFEPSVDVSTAASNIANKYSATWNDGNEVLAEIINSSVNADTHINEQLDIQNRISVLTSEVRQSIGLPSGYKYPLQDGYVSFDDLTSNLIKFSLRTDDPGEFTMPAEGSNDESVGNIQLLAKSVIQEMKDTAASNIAWAQGFLSCTYATVSDRITNFAESVKTAFSSAYTEAKETFNNVRAMLASTSCDVRTFIQQAEQQLGWAELIESNTVLNQTDVSAYTGASPYAGLDLHTAKGIATATAKTVVAAGYAIWQGMKKIGKKLWGKIRPYVMAITSDPEDLKVIDKDTDSYQVENWAYNAQTAYMNMTFTSAAADDLYSKFNSKFKGKVFAFDNYFGSYIIKMNNCELIGIGATKQFGVYYSYQFKPKCVNYQVATNSGLIKNVNGYYVHDSNVIFDPENMVSALQKFTASNNMYLNDDSGEKMFAMGFNVATQLSYGLAFAQLVEFSNQSANWNGWQGDVNTYHYSSHQSYRFDDTTDWPSLIARYNIQHDGTGKYASVTNEDFLKYTAGYKSSGDNWASNELPSDGVGQFQMFHGNNNYDVGNIPGLFLSFFILQQNDRINNPGDFLFLPYTTDTWDFGSPRYAIKTDAQNANIVDVFLSVLVLVAVVAITVIIGAKICRTIKKAKFKKWTAVKGRLDNKIWTNPEGLEPKEWRKYLRADRKLSKLNLWSTGTAASNVISTLDPSSSLSSLVGGSSDSTPINDLNYSNEQVVLVQKLIRGY